MPAELDPKQNRLLAALSSEEYDRFSPYWEIVPLEFKQILYSPNEPISYVYFVLNAVVSMVQLDQSGSIVEVATVGKEGFVGVPVLLGATQMPGEGFSQVPGYAVRMRADIFTQEVTPKTELYALLLRYTQTLFNQIAQSAACNRLHSIEERFCRWMLMTHDRVGKDQFPLTQEFIAQMLGVRRAGVSVVASTIQRAGFISYKRGKMTILDRDGLESSTCECYRMIAAEFDRLIGGK
ncbi:Crp/Fnr family transcriptional regulator [Leptolyngbya sp. NK1-12]|uniref:Crp/Fnr family transcriptional regulator n=1 Tax=Leptolyngbya sp. NK1-12 TaxID=2547451 RepID=A0AA96WYR2_9CYAN|nr:Crp/Fnr family transcriptional regulator [Leptolyngbya sp. NK1-12]WNZ27192.1 Crp/Fnr family transcriptional regulator [Leptolyngbya sp. NK1-12]